MNAKREMRVGIVGAGVMAEAMIGGLLADRAVAARELRGEEKPVSPEEG